MRDDDFGRLTNFSRAVESARDLQHAVAIMRDTFAGLGFTDVIYGWSEFARPERMSVEATFETTLDPDLVAAYVARHRVDDDYYATRCSVTTRLLDWGGKRELAEMTEEQRATNDWLARQIGNIGVCIPLGPGRFHGMGGLGLNAREHFERPGFERYLEAHGQFVGQYALTFHHALHGSGLVAESFKLSPREREFLTWAAHGLGAAEIALRMDCDVDWAYQLSRRAQRKMKARNLAHAANKALIVGAIAP